MKKWWMALSLALVLGLMWCTIPSFGGWSWAADPEFLIKGEESDEVTVNVEIEVGFTGNPEKYDPRKVKVVLQVPDDTDVQVVKDDGFKVQVKDNYDKKGQAKLTVVAKDTKYYLIGVTVKRDSTVITPEKQGADEWVFTFVLPQADGD